MLIALCIYNVKELEFPIIIYLVSDVTDIHSRL